MLAKEVPWLQVEFFRASDGKLDTIPDEEVSQTWNTNRNALYGDYEDVMDKEGKVACTAAEFSEPGVEYKFSPGERGCAHSHYRMWQVAAKAEQPTLIIEDDLELVFERNNEEQMDGAIFTQRLAQGMREAQEKSADVLYLGWAGFREGNFRHISIKEGQEAKEGSVLRASEYVWTTVAYVIWPQGAQKLLEQAKPVNQPVDNWMAWECREGRLKSFVLLDDGDDDETWAGGIASQLDFNGDSDIKKSDGGEQGDDPTEFLAANLGA